MTIFCYSDMEELSFPVKNFTISLHCHTTISYLIILFFMYSLSIRRQQSHIVINSYCCSLWFMKYSMHMLDGKFTFLIDDHKKEKKLFFCVHNQVTKECCFIIYAIINENASILLFAFLMASLTKYE